MNIITVSDGGVTIDMVAVILLAGCTGISLLFLFSFFYSIKIRRKIKETPVSQICSAPQGLVKLKGHVRPFTTKTTLLSPLTLTRCIWWDYWITDEHSESGKVAAGMSEIPFILDDGTGKCLILPKQADYIESHEHERYEPSPQLNGKPGFGFRVFTRYKYMERCLLGGTKVEVVGKFNTWPTNKELLRKAQCDVVYKKWLQACEHVFERIDNERLDELNPIFQHRLIELNKEIEDLEQAYIETFEPVFSSVKNAVVYSDAKKAHRKYLLLGIFCLFVSLAIMTIAYISLFNPFS